MRAYWMQGALIQDRDGPAEAGGISLIARLDQKRQGRRSPNLRQVVEHPSTRQRLDCGGPCRFPIVQEVTCAVAGRDALRKSCARKGGFGAVGDEMLWSPARGSGRFVEWKNELSGIAPRNWTVTTIAERPRCLLKIASEYGQNRSFAGSSRTRMKARSWTRTEPISAGTTLTDVDGN